MKKIIIITLILVLLLVGSIWGYLLVFGTPSSAGDVFADLGLGGGEAREFEVSEEPEAVVSSNEIVAPDSKKLKLLSLRTTAGSVILGSTTAEHVVRMVEQGTGHIYDIDPKTNVETRVSGTTYAGITNAYLSSDGAYAVLLANKTVGRTVHLVVLGSSSTEAKLLPSDASEFGFSEDSKRLFYVRSDKNGSIGYSYDLDKHQDTVLFSVPFLAIAAIWGDEIIIYNRPGEDYPGYAYTITPGSGLRTLTTGGVGLTVFRAGKTTLVNRHSDDGYQAYIIQSNEADTPIGKAAMPEKCAAGARTPEIIWCGDSIFSAKVGAPVSWYKGQKSLVDRLYKIDTLEGRISLVSSLDEEAKRPLDVTNMTVSADGSALAFTDKNSNTLWYFDTTVE